MALLTITTHADDHFALTVRNDQLEKLRRIRPDEWITIRGTDGKQLTLHAKSIASLWATGITTTEEPCNHTTPTEGPHP